jgi:hypothetical protein
VLFEGFVHGHLPSLIVSCLRILPGNRYEVKLDCSWFICFLKSSPEGGLSTGFYDLDSMVWFAIAQGRICPALDVDRFVLVDADGDGLVEKVVFAGDPVAEAGFPLDAVAVFVVAVGEAEGALGFFEQLAFGVELPLDCKSGGADFTKKSASQRELREILAQRLNKQPKKILNH